MSKIADDVYAVLKELFPQTNITKEHYIRYKGKQLFFDFYLRGLGILIEVQGQQHFNYTKHFHGTVENFREFKHRDNLKKEYVEENQGLILVFFCDGTDKITKELVLSRIYEAQCNG